METEAIDNQANLVNYDNENEYEIEDLGYESDEYTEDALLRIDGKQHNNCRYFDVDLTVRKLVMNRLGQLLRNFRRKLRQTYILPNQDTPSKLNEVPTKYTTILKAEDWVNFVNYTATEEYKVKSAKAKMARSKCVFLHTMGLDLIKKEIEQDEEPTWYPVVERGRGRSGTDAMHTCDYGNGKWSYARGLEVDKMSQTEGMVTKLKNQLATQGGQLQSTPTQLTPLDSPVKFIPINSMLMRRAGNNCFLNVIRMMRNSERHAKIEETV
ncbi:hypothetical protein Tco_0213347 [Tanacetum coccineum]